MSKRKHKPHKKHETPLVNSFAQWMDDVALAPATQRTALPIVRRWRDWLAEHHLTLREARTKDTRAWAKSLKDSGIRPGTVAKNINVLRCFYGYMNEELGFPHVVVPHHVRRGRRNAPQSGVISREVPTVEEMLLIRNALNRWAVRGPTERVPSPRFPRRPRNGWLSRLETLALFELSVATGLRISTMQSLTPGHLDPHTGYVVLDHSADTKFDQPYRPQATPYGFVAVTQYLEARAYAEGPPVARDDVIWEHKTEAQMGKMYRRMTHEAGLDRHFTCHSYRHFFGCMCYYQSLHTPPRRNDTIWTANQLGHAGPSTLMVYARRVDEVCQSDELWQAWALGQEIPDERLRQPRNADRMAS